MPEPLSREDVVKSVPDFEIEGGEVESGQQEPAAGQTQEPAPTSQGASSPGGESDDPTAGIEYIKQDGGEFVPKKAFLDRLNGVSTKYKETQKKLSEWEAKQAHYKEWDERGPLYKKLDGMLAAAASKYPWFDGVLRELWNSGEASVENLKKALGMVQAQEGLDAGNSGTDDPMSQAIKRVEALEEREQKRFQEQEYRENVARTRVGLEKELAEAGKRHADIWDEEVKQRVIDIAAGALGENNNLTIGKIADEYVKYLKDFQAKTLQKVTNPNPKQKKAGLEPGGGTVQQPKEPIPPHGTDEFRAHILKKLGVG